jgi:hypothetical protein
MKTITKTLLRAGLASLAALVAGGVYAETHRVPGQP